MDLWAHQLQAVRQAEDHKSFALFMEQGTGKTATMINILRRQYTRYGKVIPTLILCPKIVVNQWKQEFLKFSKLPADYIHPLVGDTNECIEILDKASKENKGLIVIVNYDKLASKPLFSALQSFAPNIIVCDESHMLKSPTSVRSKKTLQLAEKAGHRYLLTGTPILNSALDIFMQFRILDLGETFGENFFAFRGRYFEDRNAGWKGKTHYFPNFQERRGADQEINQMIYRKAMRVTKEECMDLPPLVRTRVEVQLGPEQRRLYNELKRDLVAFISSNENIGDRFVVAQTALTKALRMQQIVTGHVKDDTGGIYVIKDNPRVAALEELLEPLVHNHKVIVWCAFIENYQAARSVCEKLKVGFCELHGQVPDKERAVNAEKFMNDRDVRVCIANQKAAGTGINLTSASYSIYFSKTFALGDDMQSEARNHRGGSEIHEKVTRIDIVAPGTIDEVVTEALSKKIDISNRILELKQLGLEF